MNRTAMRRATAASASIAGGLLIAGCNTVVSSTPGASNALGTPATEYITIEHTSLRSRISVYESALRACKQRSFDQAIFQKQANEDPKRAPAEGPQLSTFLCR
ncbi:hypothetical protein [Xylophilus sp. GOD-11R]|uniref:hypothetical protein n=1 Tax=Xylophilus sp. GOD-11R TaxID=3089814 RepID=UPI00298C0542|nr:hypothetical protein [Xylophilus sp. GOD-11R]WPB57397.1 hypothetical protein R9X41_01720 [Xylophilus sp. GOD-11R]